MGDGAAVGDRSPPATVHTIDFLDDHLYGERSSVERLESRGIVVGAQDMHPGVARCCATGEEIPSVTKLHHPSPQTATWSKILPLVHSQLIDPVGPCQCPARFGEGCLNQFDFLTCPEAAVFGLCFHCFIDNAGCICPCFECSGVPPTPDSPTLDLAVCIAEGRNASLYRLISDLLFSVAWALGLM
jgi:hypothetical protein